MEKKPRFRQTDLETDNGRFFRVGYDYQAELGFLQIDSLVIGEIFKNEKGNIDDIKTILLEFKDFVDDALEQLESHLK